MDIIAIKQIDLRRHLELMLMLIVFLLSMLLPILSFVTLLADVKKREREKS